MTSLVHPLPPARSVGATLRQVLLDLRLALVMSAFVALVITLVVGHPEILYEQLVYSGFIAVMGYAVVDAARLFVWSDPDRHPRQWLPLLAVAAVAAPIAHFSGMHLAAALLGHDAPGLAAYPTLPRVSMIGLTFMVLCAGTFLEVHRGRLRRIEQEHRDARLRAETIERQALQAQLRLLQAQIEPHMLFNTLANLQGLIALDPGRANTMLDQLIQYLRATLGASRAERTTLGEEFAAMEAYLGLMGVRMGERLAYHLALPPGLRAASMPPMLLQPLVENAIVHGLEPKIEGGTVRISAGVVDGLLEICVNDTGLGLDPAARSAGGGVGVATTRERLRVLYGERASIVLAPGQPQGTSARLTLPLETP